MIDWLTLEVPLASAHKVHGGAVYSVGPDGDLEWRAEKWLAVEGSHSARVQARRSPQALNALQISGNPSKLLQGHNLFGSNDIRGVAFAMVDRVTRTLGLEVTDADRARWMQARVTRVDVTESWALGTLDRVRTAIRSLEHGSRLRNRGKGSLTQESTLYYGKRSRRWSFKYYAKGDEIAAKGHKLPEELTGAFPQLPEWAKDKLRGELTLRSLELKRLGLQYLDSWCDVTAGQIYEGLRARIEMTGDLQTSVERIEGLPPRLQLVLQAWRDGHDLRQSLSRRTWYRYRKELLGYGVDIAILQPRDRSNDNVIPLRVVLVGKPAEVPEWAIGTPLYFDPKAA